MDAYENEHQRQIKCGEALKDKTKNYDLYDWLNIYSEYSRICPKCKSDDVKFATHSRVVSMYSFSVQCNNCRCYDKGNKEDFEKIVPKWHIFKENKEK